METDSNLYEKCNRESQEKVKQKEAEREAAESKWKIIIRDAQAKGFMDSDEASTATTHSANSTCSLNL
jgi:hypothetical protein